MGTVAGTAGRIIIANLPRGSDLLSSMEELAGGSGVTGGLFTAIGTVKRAAFSYYDQSMHEYLTMRIDEPLEIVTCSGSFGVLGNRPKVHCHLALAGRDGHVYGGHLAPGTEVFVGEVHLIEVKGLKLERKVDQETGLAMMDF